VSAPALDPTVLDQLLRDLDGDADAVRELVGLFRASAPKLVADAREACARRDADAYRRATHTLKSSAGTDGARELQRLAREAEAGAPDAKRVEEMAAELTRVMQALDARFGDGSRMQVS
jgi:HPt (histidine-containing phosphotransfer) domain-containing protein